MSVKFAIIKNDSEDIDFSYTCLIYGVIDFSEFKDWIYYVIENSDDVPTYLFSILDIEDKFEFILNMHEILGFFSGWEGEGQEEEALNGIGYIRYKNYFDDNTSKGTTLKALKENPHIEKKFRATFPFIEW